MFPFGQALVDGLLLSLVFGVIVIGSLRWNPRIWMQDFPEAIRATQPPLTPVEKRQKTLITVIFFAAIIGLPIWFNAQMRASMGADFTFQTSFVHTWLMFQIVNLFDAVVLDWLYIAVMKPRYLILPGSEGVVEQALTDVRWHIGNYLKGVVIVSVLALPIAAVALI